jgi:hypothetical protein
MHLAAFVFFLTVLMLAVSVIATMLRGHQVEIVSALLGQKSVALDSVTFFPPVAVRRSASTHHRPVDAPLSLAA